MLVRLFRGERELGGVGVQVALGCFDRGVSEDVTDDVKRDAGVSEPCGTGMPEVMSSQTGMTESLHQIGPVRCLRERPGGEDPRPGVLMFAALSYSSEHRLQWLKDRHPARLSALGGLEAQPVRAGEVLSRDGDEAIAPIDVADDQTRDLRYPRREKRKKRTKSPYAVCTRRHASARLCASPRVGILRARSAVNDCVRRLTRVRAGFPAMISSRTASLNTRVRADTVFFSEKANSRLLTGRSSYR